MSAAFSHSQPHLGNENKNPQASTQSSERGDGQEETQELTPDRPPSPPSQRSPVAQEAGTQKPRRPRGFAAMDRKLVSEIARKGGKAAHSAGTAHEFTTEEARVAGRKGGRATHAKRRARTEGEAPPSGTPHGGGEQG
jgi:general stress protein YciG